MYFFMLLMIFLIFIFIFIQNKRDQKLTEEIEDHLNRLLSSSDCLTVEEFLDIRTYKVFKSGRKYYSNLLTYSGIYILYNCNKKMYYVGQSNDVFKRVTDHFSGRGNGDVYADYKYGSEFIINTISLEKSGFKNLNNLEKHFIDYYDAYKNGYNKTRGNS